MSTIAATICIASNIFSCMPSAIHVIDGDTVSIGRERIRILGIDAPEMDGSCKREVELANLSKDFVAKTLSGQRVIIDRQGRDKYRRTLAQITVNDKDIAKSLMENGLARKWEKKWRPGLDDVWCSQ